MSTSLNSRSEPGAQAWFNGSGIQNSGSLSIGRDFNITSQFAPTHEDEAQHCLRDLYVTDPSDDMQKLKRKMGDRASGTCEWIHDTEHLTTWLGSEQTAEDGQMANVLWLHGYPGTGKSTMAMFLIEELSEAFSMEDGKTLAFFFCDSSFEKRRTATSVIRGLLFQLMKQHSKLLNYILPKHNERREKLKGELLEDFDALWAVFMDVAADQDTGRKYCIIDALDECDRESQVTLSRQLQKTFQSQNAPQNIRILVTSRPYDEIREHLEDFVNKDLASFPAAKQDVDQCIEEKVTNLAKRKRYTDKVQKKVSNILREKAAGTFLWVGLACRELEDIPSKDAIQLLDDMPKGLQSLYARLLETALEGESSDREIQRILNYVAVCLRPLSVLELSEACQLFQGEDDMETRIQYTREQIASCRLMVVIQDEKVLLLHQSVKDFLVGAGAGHFIDDLKAHADLAYRCVDTLIKEFHGRKQPQANLLTFSSPGALVEVVPSA
ncbi:hypothetical protein IL306_005188 [Fusarium sp. DS 682]|nr:hypothetical protein IL306_005188 [Fusarium sp. DS 682]